MDNDPLNNAAAQKKLAERAAQLAVQTMDNITDLSSTLLVFMLGNTQKYAVDFNAIERVIPYQTIRSISGLNPPFSGLIYYDAEFWPVINFQTIFHTESSTDNFILLYAGINRYALTIGSVLEQKIYSPQQDVLSHSSHSFLLGIYQCDIAVVNISAILNLIETSAVHGMNG